MYPPLHLECSESSLIKPPDRGNRVRLLFTVVCASIQAMRRVSQHIFLVTSSPQKWTRLSSSNGPRAGGNSSTKWACVERAKASAENTVMKCIFGEMSLLEPRPALYTGDRERQKFFLHPLFGDPTIPPKTVMICYGMQPNWFSWSTNGQRNNIIA